MADFESWRQYLDFSHFVMRNARYILGPRNQGFLEAVKRTSKKRERLFRKGDRLWRAQLGHATDCSGVEAPFPPERMKPLPDRANEGRVNPKGIPCLYCSTERDTAMTEARPRVGSSVCAAEFVMQRDLTMVDCSADSRGLAWYQGVGEPAPAAREGYVWDHINWAFSQPVNRTDDAAEYAPTQVLAEAFRNAGYDGIVYGSKLGSGENVAIFDLASAELASCQLYRVEAVTMKFVTASDPYLC